MNPKTWDIRKGGAMVQNVRKELELIRKKYIRRQRFDDSFDDQGSWATLNGTHVHFNNAGDIDKGPSALKEKMNRHEYSTKAEYQREKKKSLKRHDALQKRLERDYAKKKKEIKERLGDGISKRFNEIDNDPNLTDQEKERRLEAVYKEQEEYVEQCLEIDNKYKERKESIENNYRVQFDEEYEFRRIDGDNGLSDKVGRDIINPDHLDENCQRCAIAYELRARGLDVTASPGESGDLAMTSRILSCFVKPDMKTYMDYDLDGDHEIARQTLKQMKEWGDGARALVLAQYGSFGHAFNLINKNGKVYLQDSQSGQSWDAESKDTIEQGLQLTGAFNATLVRTDNAKLSFGTEDYVRDVA